MNDEDKVVLILGIFASLSLGASPLSLREAFHTALQKTETAPLGEARMAQSEARVDAALARFFPSVSFGANYTRQDAKSASATASAIFPGVTSFTRFNVSQSLFEGGRDLGLIGSAKATRAAEQHNLIAAKTTLFMNVARDYYAVLLADQEVNSIRKTSVLATNRLNEIKARTEIGRSRKVEQLAAQAQLLVLQSQLKAAEGVQTTSRERFSLTSGVDKSVSLEDIQELPILRGLESYLGSLETRPDLVALKENAHAVENAVSVARAGHLPSLTASGNFYLTRMGPQQGNRWDVGVTLSMPLFAGGLVSAQVEEQLQRLKEAELLLHQARRQAELSIRTAFGSLESSLQQTKVLNAALQATEQNFREQEKNYKFGQATNLDVIQALNMYMDTKRTLDRTRYQAMTSWAELQAATAQLP